MTTAADLVNRVENKLLGGARESRNKLTGSLTDSATTITLTYDLAALKAGAAVYVDLEGMYVWEVDDTAKTATVERGQFGTTAASHDAASIVYVNPRFPKFDILGELNNDLADLSSPANGLFQMKTVELTYSAAASGYDLTSVTDVLAVYAVEAKFTGLAGDWQPVGFRAARNQNTTDFPSGFSVYVDDGQPGQALRVIYKAPFAALTGLSSDMQSAGLPSSANDIPVLGAAARLLGPREAKRVQTESQGDTRRAEEVGVGGARTAAAELWQERDRRIRSEAARLGQQYPAAYR